MILIIDEINRANLASVLGEAFYLFEPGLKENGSVAVTLVSGDLPVDSECTKAGDLLKISALPSNLYVIATMNTADRSLAMMDYALRRRFAFFEMNPGFNTNGFKAYKTGLNNAKFDSLISCVERLNEVIAADESLGEGFCIGHSYFCNLKEVTELCSKQTLHVKFRARHHEPLRVFNLKVIELRVHSTVCRKHRRLDFERITTNKEITDAGHKRLALDPSFTRASGRKRARVQIFHYSAPATQRTAR